MSVSVPALCLLVWVAHSTRFAHPAVRTGGGPVVIAAWSVKGGSGTTVVAAAVAVELSTANQPGVIVDLGGETAGDVGALLGKSTQPRPGFTDWLSADETVNADALSRLVDETGIPHLLSVGGGRAAVSDLLCTSPFTADRIGIGLRSLADRYGFVVIDLGSLDDALANTICEHTDASVLILRPCSLSIRAAVRSSRRVFGAVLVGEGSRSLVRPDIEGLLGVPVLAHIRSHPAIADAVDNGRFAKGVPREMRRSLRPLVSTLTGKRVLV
jgi:hypothetical protein